MKSFKFLTTLFFLISFSASSAMIPATLYGEAENGDDLWTFTDTSLLLDDAGFFLNAEFGSFNSSPSRSFGLYQYDFINDVMLNALQIFDDATLATGLASANVNLDNGTQMLSTSYGVIDTSLALGLAFGFYFESDGIRYYSQNEYNAGSEDFFGLYTESDPFSVYNTHLYATDGQAGNNLDWVKMSISDIRTGTDFGIAQVPEPTSIFLFGLAISLLLFRNRKKVQL